VLIAAGGPYFYAHSMAAPAALPTEIFFRPVAHPGDELRNHISANAYPFVVDRY
jgi:hypothetical protein